jgi:hypothetical protein
MKKTIFSTLLFVLITTSIFSQKTVPATTLNTLDGKTVSVNEVVKNNNITVIVFWAIWDNNGVNELNALNSKITAPFYAVSIDPKTDESKVLPFVQAKNWKYNFLLDPNKELYRALGGKFPPMVLIVDNTGKVLYEKQGFAAGDEAIIIAKVNELSGK